MKRSTALLVLVAMYLLSLSYITYKSANILETINKSVIKTSINK